MQALLAMRNLDILILVAAILLLVCIYLYGLCSFYLKSSKKIKPLFCPPEGLSALDCFTIYKGRFTQQFITVAILSMQAEKYLKIVCKQKTYDCILNKLEGAGNALYDRLASFLFIEKKSFVFTDPYEKILPNKKAYLLKKGTDTISISFAIKRATSPGDYYYRISQGAADEYLNYLILNNCLDELDKYYNIASKKYIKSNYKLLTFSAVISAAAIFSAMFLYLNPDITCWLSVVLIFINVMLITVLKQRTFEGESLLQQLLAFKKYLGLNAKERQAGCPKITKELFDKYLPYAFALGEWKAWAESFYNAGAEPGRQYYSAITLFTANNHDVITKLNSLIKSIKSTLDVCLRWRVGGHAFFTGNRFANFRKLIDKLS